MVDREEYNRRINLIISRDKNDFLESIAGWKCVLDSYQILFDAKMIKVKYHLIEGEKSNHNFDVSCKGYALKGIFELFHQHYFYIVPEGFDILFEGNGSSIFVSNINQLRNIIDKYGDMYLNPSKY